MQNIKEGLEGHAVDWYSDVFDIVFPNVEAKAVNHKWKKQLKEPERKKAKDEEKDDDDDDDDD